MKKLLSLAAFIGLAASASAATVTYNNSVSINEGINTVLSLPKFNISGQTLIGVTLTVELDVPDFETAIDNDSDNAATGTISFGTLGGVTFTSTVATTSADLTDSINSDDFNITTQSSNLEVTGTTGDDTANFNVPPANSTDYASFTTAPILVGDSNHSVFSGLFAQYIGAGDFDMTLLIDFVTDFNLSTGGGGGGETRFQGTVPSVTYRGSVTYEYIPEPSTAVLFGLVGAGMMVRRRRA